jgi:hypothetical protein
MVESIFVERFLAIHFGCPAEGVDEVLLDAPEVVFRLSVSKAEDCARVGAAEDVWHAVFIAIDRDVASEWVCHYMNVTQQSCEYYQD